MSKKLEHIRYSRTRAGRTLYISFWTNELTDDSFNLDLPELEEGLMRLAGKFTITKDGPAREYAAGSKILQEDQ